MTEAIQAVVFDIGGVLMENIQEFYLPDLAREHGLDGDQLLRIGYRHGDAWGLGQASEKDYWRGILADAGLAPGLLPMLVARTEAYVRPIAETWTVVEALDPRLRRGILSNTTREWIYRIRAAVPLDERFDPIVLSCDVGACKPGPAIYGHLLARLDLPPAAVLFVDDRDENLLAAAAAGIQGVLFTGPASLRQELRRRGLLGG
jgi:HAD superfamily hydrolase (TIGR01509 family)